MRSSQELVPCVEDRQDPLLQQTKNAFCRSNSFLESMQYCGDQQIRNYPLTSFLARRAMHEHPQSHPNRDRRAAPLTPSFKPSLWPILANGLGPLSSSLGGMPGPAGRGGRGPPSHATRHGYHDSGSPAPPAHAPLERRRRHSRLGPWPGQHPALSPGPRADAAVGRWRWAPTWRMAWELPVRAWRSCRTRSSGASWCPAACVPPVAGPAPSVHRRALLCSFSNC